MANTSAIFQFIELSYSSSRMMLRQSRIADDWLGGIYPEVTECLRGNSDKQGIKPERLHHSGYFSQSERFLSKYNLPLYPAKVETSRTRGFTDATFFSETALQIYNSDPTPSKFFGNFFSTFFSPPSEVAVKGVRSKCSRCSRYFL